MVSGISYDARNCSMQRRAAALPSKLRVSRVASSANFILCAQSGLQQATSFARERETSFKSGALRWKLPMERLELLDAREGRGASYQGQITFDGGSFVRFVGCRCCCLEIARHEAAARNRAVRSRSGGFWRFSRLCDIYLRQKALLHAGVLTLLFGLECLVVRVINCHSHRRIMRYH